MTWGDLLRRAARKAGRALHEWGSRETEPALPHNVIRIGTYYVGTHAGNAANPNRLNTSSRN